MGSDSCTSVLSKDTCNRATVTVTRFAGEEGRAAVEVSTLVSRASPHHTTATSSQVHRHACKPWNVAAIWFVCLSGAWNVYLLLADIYFELLYRNISQMLPLIHIYSWPPWPQQLDLNSNQTVHDYATHDKDASAQLLIPFSLIRVHTWRVSLPSTIQVTGRVYD